MRGIPPVGYAVYRDDGHLNSTRIEYAELTPVDIEGTLSDGFRNVTRPEPFCLAQAYNGVCEPTLPEWDARSCKYDPVYKVAHARNCSLTGLTPNTYYRFRIAAINQFGVGPISDAAELKSGSVGNVFNTLPYFSAAESGVTELFSLGQPQSIFNETTTPSITFCWDHSPEEDGDFIFNYRGKLTLVSPLPADPNATLTLNYIANGTQEYPLPLDTKCLTISAML